MSRNSIFGESFFGNLFAEMDKARKQRAKENAGITELNGKEGIERLGIPHNFRTIEIRLDGYFFCYTDDGRIFVYTSAGKFCFDCNDVDYLKQGMFLAGRKKEVIIVGKERADEFGYALYHEDTKLSEPIFRFCGMNGQFNEQGFCVVNLFGKYGSAVINKSGEILFESEGFEHPYLYGVICSAPRNYINLLTGDVICEKGYGSTLSTKEFRFIQVDSNCVYQINTNTGEYIVHGVKPEPKPEKEATSPPARIIENTKPSEKKQERNSPCACGSGKKFKHCCGK